MERAVGHVIVNGERHDRYLSNKNGIVYRDGTADKRTLTEIPRSYGWLDVKGKTVLDIGAHIGGFSKWACDADAAQVVSVEPDPCNFELLTVNAPDAKHIRSAVVGENTGPVHLYYTKRGFSHGMNSTKKFRGRSSIEVHAIEFNMLLSTFHPSVIKVDCEGAEYDFLRGDQLPEYVTEVAAEIHFSKHEWRDILGPKLIKSFDGWEVVTKPVIGLYNWTTIAGWRRFP